MNGNHEPPLQLDADTMRRMGYAVIDRMVEWQTSIRDRPVWDGAGRDEMERVIAPHPPAIGAGAEGFDALLDHLLHDIVPRGARTDHPRFFAFVPGNATWPSVLGDLIATGTNVFQGTWLASAGVSQMEMRVIEWFRDWLGLPHATGGLLVSGGSAANLTALACARQLRYHGHSDAARIYTSSETHSSIARAARILGFRDDQLRVIDVDREERIDMSALERAVTHDRAAGLDPFLVVANGGTTSTGSVDPIRDLSTYCSAQNMWLHVDAAYGGFAVLTERGRALLDGIENADSVTLDPHKWLYQPFEVGCLLVRDAKLLRQAFHVMADYLRDTIIEESSDAPVNFSEHGIQLTRYARTIKIWLSLNYFGVDAFRDTIDYTIDLAAAAEMMVRENDALELVTPARLGIVCFRRRVPVGTDSDTLNEKLVRRLMESGTAMVSSTRVQGQYAIRMCVLTYRSSLADVRYVIDWIAGAEPARASSSAAQR